MFVVLNMLYGASLKAQMVKKSACQRRRLGFDPWVRKIPWRRNWLPTPVFLPGEFHGERSLAGYSPWGCRVGHDRGTNTFTWYKY